MYIPSGPRLFEADGGGFRDDFFRLPMVAKKKGMPKVVGYRNGNRDYWSFGPEWALL